MTELIYNDIELAAWFSAPCGSHYSEAIRHIRALPVFALIKFRHVLENLTENLVNKNKVPTRNGELSTTVDALLHQKVLTFADANTMHRIRKLSNAAAHAPRSIDLEEGPKAVPDVNAKNAVTCRNDLVKLFRSLYEKETGLAIEDLALVDSRDSEWKQLLFDAMVENNPASKYEAGLLCYAKAERIVLDSAGILIVGEDVRRQYESLMRHAALFFQLSNNLSENEDARVRFAVIVRSGVIQGYGKDEAIEILRDSANRGRGDACLHYGDVLYEDLHDLVQAPKYWKAAIELGYAEAYNRLGWMHLLDASLSNEEGITYLELGAEAEDKECSFSLGRIYTEGTLTTKDVAKAHKYLSAAAAFGHNKADKYRTMFLEGGLEHLQASLAAIADAIQRSSQPISARPANKLITKFPVNQPCPCGSGKKYKKCCGIQA